MIESLYLTTRQAAVVLGVHESSVKRWCASGGLAFETTAGGHRRIAMRHLMQFARQQALDCAFLAFESHAEEAWAACMSALNKNDFSRLADLFYDGIARFEYTPAYRLIDFCLEQGVARSELFDGVLAPVMHRIGREWHAGLLDIGEEHRMTEMLRDVMSRLRQTLPAPGEIPRDRVALVGGCEGNLHDLGAQAVRLLLEEYGWRVIYVGANMPARYFASMQTRYNARIVCISFVSPSVASDVNRVVEVLGRFYDARTPYRLVLGGSAIGTAQDLEPASVVFQDVKTCTSVFSFENWLKTTDFSSVA